MAAKKKTPTLAQVQKLAREKLGDGGRVSSQAYVAGSHLWMCLAHTSPSGAELHVWAKSRSAALRALYAALEAL